MNRMGTKTCVLAVILCGFCICGADCTTELFIDYPHDGDTFTADAPHDLTVWLYGEHGNLGKSTGTVYVDGTEVATWDENGYMSFSVAIPITLTTYGTHTIRAVSDNGEGDDTVTVTLRRP